MSGQQTRLVLLACLAALACQDYAFETRQDLRSRGRLLKEVITTVTPADILFVIDNSGSMIDEVTELENNIGLFIDSLTASANDYQIGFITPDVECNVPGLNCGAGGTTSDSCCLLTQCSGEAQCGAQQDCINGHCVCNPGFCDGGRLRADPTGTRIFQRPPDDEVGAWKQTLRDAISSLGCKGSGYEATLEAARRAVVCARPGVTVGPGADQCPEQEIADTNAGFLRPEADLVIVFVTDEDDCSFLPPATAYRRLTDNSSPTEQQAKFCSPHECYAYRGASLDGDLDGLWKWSDPDESSGTRRFSCAGQPRTENPPLPAAPADFLDGVISAKSGDVTRVRAGAILGGVLDPAQPLGLKGSACYSTTAGPSDDCGCWANVVVDVFCDITTPPLGDGLATHEPPGSEIPQCGGSPVPSPGGCEAMSGGRILTFLETLATRRGRNDTIVDSICQLQYNETMSDIARILKLDACFDIGQFIPVEKRGSVRVVYDGRVLDQNDWGMAEDSTKVCLQGRLEPRIGARFEIFLLDDN